MKQNFCFFFFIGASATKVGTSKEFLVWVAFRFYSKGQKTTAGIGLQFLVERDRNRVHQTDIELLFTLDPLSLFLHSIPPGLNRHQYIIHITGDRRTEKQEKKYIEKRGGKSV